MTTFTPAQRQLLRDGINLTSIALSKLDAFVLPEIDELSPRAQEQLQEIRLCLIGARDVFHPKRPNK